jgi:hypothetical protein
MSHVDLAWVVIGVALHVSAQLCRGIAWQAVLAASWPVVTRRRACAWHVCGSGLSGVLSARGADILRIALARRELPRDATASAVSGALVAEGSFAALSGVAITAAAAAVGVGAVAPPSPVAIAGVIAGAVAIVLLSHRSLAIRRIVRDVARGAAVVREPGVFIRRVLPLEVSGRVLRTIAVACFLHAVGLPAGPVVVLAACAAQGAGNSLPIPGAGWAASAAALVVALPAGAGHPVSAQAVGALVFVQSAVLTAVGVTLSLVLLAQLLGAHTPRRLIAALRLLVPRPTAPARQTA